MKTGNTWTKKRFQCCSFSTTQGYKFNCPEVYVLTSAHHSLLLHSCLPSFSSPSSKWMLLCVRGFMSVISIPILSRKVQVISSVQPRHVHGCQCNCVTLLQLRCGVFPSAPYFLMGVPWCWQIYNHALNGGRTTEERSLCARIDFLQFLALIMESFDLNHTSNLLQLIYLS